MSGRQGEFVLVRCSITASCTVSPLDSPGCIRLISVRAAADSAQVVKVSRAPPIKVKEVLMCLVYSQAAKGGS